MTIGAILKQKPHNIVIVRPTDRVFDVVRGLARQKVGVAVVMEGDVLVGIISERDVMRGLDAEGPAVLETTVDKQMIHNVSTCSPHTTVDQAIDAMTKGRFATCPSLTTASYWG